MRCLTLPATSEINKHKPKHSLERVTNSNSGRRVTGTKTGSRKSRGLAALSANMERTLETLDEIRGRRPDRRRRFRATPGAGVCRGYFRRRRDVSLSDLCQMGGFLQERNRQR